MMTDKGGGRGNLIYRVVLIMAHTHRVIKMESSFYPRTVYIMTIHFINPVSRVKLLVSCNTWSNIGNAVENNQHIMNQPNRHNH